MMCYKSKEDPLYEAARKHPIAAKRFMGWSEEAIMLCYKPKEQFIELLKFLAERRIMENEIESLIKSTIGKIKTALDSSKPGEAKVYTEMLVLLRQTLSILPPNWAYNKTGRVDINRPFKEISDKHNPDV